MEFDWKQYRDNYPDLYYAGLITEVDVTKHYYKYGKNENRTFLKKDENNTSFGLGGRFGNILFYNFVADYISQRIDLKFNYRCHENMDSLGITVHTGTKEYPETHILTDSNIDSIFDEIPNKNILLRGYFQTPTVAKYIHSKIQSLKDSIIQKNPYEYTNNNVFIHVRLGDIIGIHEDFSYYYSVLSGLQFDKGFISSDTIKHSICIKLIKKFNLQIFNGSEVETLQFGSTNRHIVLSKGTFSWYIGALSFDSNVYYPEKINGKLWHGDIFCLPEWNKVSYM